MRTVAATPFHCMGPRSISAQEIDGATVRPHIDDLLRFHRTYVSAVSCLTRKSALPTIVALPGRELLRWILLQDRYQRIIPRNSGRRAVDEHDPGSSNRHMGS